MAEYIEREALIKAIKVHEMAENDRIETGYNWALDDIEEIVRQMPAADVQPVKRGEWVYYKNNGIWDIHKCTVCNTPFELPMDVVASSVFCYCPHCGADMRGEDNA